MAQPLQTRQRDVFTLKAWSTFVAQQATSDSGRQDYTALAHTWMELAHVFESDNALLKDLSAAGWNVVPPEPRWPIKLRAS